MFTINPTARLLLACAVALSWALSARSQVSRIVPGAVVPSTIPCNDEQAAQGEKYLQEHPQDTERAACLLDFYVQRLKAPDLRLRRLQLIRWVIENHPDIRLDAHLQNGLHLSTEDAVAYSQVRQLWLTQVKRFPHDAQVLSNAADCLAITDREIAAVWLKRAREINPGNETIVRRLANLYADAIIGIYETGPDLMPTSVDAMEAHSHFAKDAYQDARSEATLATWTGLAIHNWTRFLLARRITNVDYDTIAETLLLRAANLSYPNPTKIDALRDFYRDESHRPSSRITPRSAVVEMPPDKVSLMLTATSQAALQALANQKDTIPVRVGIVIGIDGHVWVSAAESPSFGQMALAAQNIVETLTYRPLRINDVAVRVKSTTTIHLKNSTPAAQ
jgi:hypothetical protein